MGHASQFLDMCDLFPVQEMFVQRLLHSVSSYKHNITADNDTDFTRILSSHMNKMLDLLRICVWFSAESIKEMFSNKEFRSIECWLFSNMITDYPFTFACFCIRLVGFLQLPQTIQTHESYVDWPF